MRIALVTPNYNYADYLEVCIKSILGQGVDGLEYHICDAGSTDGSLDIIKKYEPHLASWRSGPDDGPYAAINEVLMSSDCDVFGWLNSDDMLLPGTLRYVSEVFSNNAEVSWLTSLRPSVMNWAGDLTSSGLIGISRESWYDGRHLGGKRPWSYGFIQQESTFFRRELWQAVGGLDLLYPLAADFDLWCRFFEKENVHVTDRMLGCFRFHTANRSGAIQNYLNECRSALQRSREASQHRPAAIRSRLPSIGTFFCSNKIRRAHFPWSYTMNLIQRTSQAEGKAGLKIIPTPYF